MEVWKPPIAWPKVAPRHGPSRDLPADRITHSVGRDPCSVSYLGDGNELFQRGARLHLVRMPCPDLSSVPAASGDYAPISTAVCSALKAGWGADARG
jgi:hypothetical protein